MTRLYAIALFAVGTMCLIAAFLAPRAADVPVAAPPAAHMAVKGDSEALMLRRDGSGQFHLDGAVNNASVNFLIDTGADMVALTEDQAAELGLTPSPEDFQPAMQTASGTGYGAPVVLDELEVAGTTLRNVDAVVVRGLGVNLLGQSVLRKLGSVELKGDTMVIRPTS